MQSNNASNTCQEIVNQFTRILSANNKQIKDAEAVLQFLHEKNDFFTALLTIPSMDQVTRPIAKMASVYAMNYCRKINSSQNQALINNAANKMLEFLGSNIDFGYKEQVAAALEYLIRVDSKCIILSIMQPNYVELVEKAAQINDISRINFQLLALQANILGDYGINPTNTLYPFIEKVLVPLAILAYKIIEYGGKVVNENKTEAEKALKFGCIFCETIIKYLKKFLFLKSPITKLLFEPVFPQLINLILNFNLPENSLDTTVFYYNQKHEFQKIVVLIHTIKSHAITILTQGTRLINHCKQLDSTSCQIMTQAPMFIQEFVRSMSQLLNKTQYYKLRSVSQVRVCEEILQYLLANLRLGNHFILFSELKNNLIFSCIFKMLAFKPSDYDNYYHDCDEFVNSVLQIIDLTPSSNILKKQQKQILEKQKKMEGVSGKSQQSQYSEVQDDDDQEDHSHLKTLAANLLTQIVKYMDGSLTEVIFYCVSVIDDRINIQLSKNLMLLVLCILRDDVKHRDDLKASIGKVLLGELKDLGLPKKSQQEPYNVQYSLVLLAMSRYSLLVHEYFERFFDKLFIYIEMLMSDEKIEQTPKLIACQVITTFMAVEQGSIFAQKLLRLFNRLLNSTTVNHRYLQCIQLLIKQQDFEFKDDFLEITVLIERICALIKWQLQLNVSGKGSKTKQGTQHFALIHQLWNILKQICNCQYIMPDIAPKIQENLTPLISLIDGSNQLILDEHIFDITSRLLKRKVYTSLFQIKVLEIIPKGFYVGKKKYSLFSSFEAIQLIIYYGKDTLLQNMGTVKTLILLCIDSMNNKTANENPRTQSDQCEGVLILQSLIISCCDNNSMQANSFDGELWNMLAKNVIQKITSSNIFYDFYKTSLLNLLALILVHGHKYFSENDNLTIILLLLQNCQCFEQCPNSSVFIICLSDMLLLYSYPFVSNNYILLMDMLITLLKIKSMNKDKILENRQLDDQERHYENMKQKMRTCFDDIDEFQYFRSKILRVREICPQVEGIICQLPEIKKNYLKQVMHVRKVGNEVRRVFKITNIK